MKKIKTGLMTACIILMSGCAVQPPQKNIDVEPMLVGRPVADRINDTKAEINDQLFLLEQIKTGKKVGSYDVVKHNNDLDARVGSSMTIPKAYADSDKPPVPEVVALKVKRIDWQNNSLNKLSANIAKALGYQLVIKQGSVSDKNINFISENQTMEQVVEKLKRESASFAEIVVIPQNKTFNIFYK